jgi:uncharacterized protein YjbI with pentapeptide repeats
VNEEAASKDMAISNRTVPSYIHRKWERWHEVVVADLALALVLGGMIFWVSDRSENRRLVQSERLENLRFVRGLSADDFTDRPFRGIDLRDQNLAVLLLLGADFNGADLSGAVLEDTILAFADFENADLSDANLSNASLEGAILRGADLSNANLSDAQLNGDLLPGREADPKDLRPSDENSEITVFGADLSGADLSGADLSFAELTRAAFYPPADPTEE